MEEKPSSPCTARPGRTQNPPSCAPTRAQAPRGPVVPRHRTARPPAELEAIASYPDTAQSEDQHAPSVAHNRAEYPWPLPTGEKHLGRPPSVPPPAPDA